MATTAAQAMQTVNKSKLKRVAQPSHVALRATQAGRAAAGRLEAKRTESHYHIIIIKRGSPEGERRCIYDKDSGRRRDLVTVTTH